MHKITIVAHSILNDSVYKQVMRLRNTIKSLKETDMLSLYLCGLNFGTLWYWQHVAQM